MSTIYTLRLSSMDVFQIIDALNSRAESYRHTARYLSGMCEINENIAIEECQDHIEAQEIANHFQDIVKTVENQM